MKYKTVYLIRMAIFALISMGLCDASAPWGFFGHRKINRQAVFSLPAEMIAFYKKNIEYITAHSVDPDKRRYAVDGEAIKHYIDLDNWGEFSFEEFPRTRLQAILQFAKYSIVDGSDTIVLQIADPAFEKFHDSKKGDCSLDLSGFYNWLVEKKHWDFSSKVQEFYWHEVGGFVVCDIANQFYENLIVEDQFSDYGILPYHLDRMYDELQDAFLEKNPKKILRISAEFGHYIADAHVPLHTTKNYNGQFTGQDGIHAFWESRLPELFANSEYDFFVGKASYIDDPKTYFWQIIKKSHFLLDSVFSVEKRLSETFPADQKFCFEERLDRIVRVQCEEYSRAYSNALNGMVESRMRESILAVANVWYSAWIDAGQPDLRTLMEVEWTKKELREMEELQKLSGEGNGNVRTHNN